MLSQLETSEHFNKEKEIVYVNHSDSEVLHQKVEELTKQLEL